MATRSASLSVRATGPGRQVLCALLFASWMTGSTAHSVAETYSYVDDQGTVVFTDNPNTIAPRYRQRVKRVQTREDAPPLSEALKLDRLSLPDVGGGLTIAGLTPTQSRTLILGFCAAILMFAVMMFTGSSAVRVLMRWLLILLAIGTTASIYFSNEPVTGKATVRAKELEKRQHEKAQQIERMEPTAEDR